MRAPTTEKAEPLVSIRDARLHYRVGGALSALRGRSNIVKAVDGVLPEHEAQLLTYLKFAQLRVGLLLNFNALHLRDGLRRRVLEVP